jgi:hypothetical protein
MPGKDFSSPPVSSSLIGVKEEIIGEVWIPFWHLGFWQHPHGLNRSTGPSLQIPFRFIAMKLNGVQF